MAQFVLSSTLDFFGDVNMRQAWFISISKLCTMSLRAEPSEAFEVLVRTLT